MGQGRSERARVEAGLTVHGHSRFKEAASEAGPTLLARPQSTGHAAVRARASPGRHHRAGADSGRNLLGVRSLRGLERRRARFGPRPRPAVPLRRHRIRGARCPARRRGTGTRAGVPGAGETAASGSAVPGFGPDARGGRGHAGRRPRPNRRPRVLAAAAHSRPAAASSARPSCGSLRIWSRRSAPRSWRSFCCWPG